MTDIKSNLSVCIITCEQDQRFLQDCLNSLPKDVEIIVMNTQPIHPNSDGTVFPAIMTGWTDNVKYVNWSYRYVNPFDNDFSFSDARNQARKFCTKDWILTLDTDERIQIPDLTIFDNVPDEIGGFSVAIFNQPNHHDVVLSSEHPMTKGMYAFTCRISRKQYQYIGYCHEQIMPAIQKDNKQIYHSDLVINHLGYQNLTKDQIYQKKFRNIRLECLDYIHNTDIQLAKFYLVNLCRDIETLMQLGYINQVTMQLPDLKSIQKVYNEFGLRMTFDDQLIKHNIIAACIALSKNPTNKFQLENLFANIKITEQYDN